MTLKMAHVGIIEFKRFGTSLTVNISEKAQSMSELMQKHADKVNFSRGGGCI